MMVDVSLRSMKIFTISVYQTTQRNTFHVVSFWTRKNTDRSGTHHLLLLIKNTIKFKIPQMIPEETPTAPINRVFLECSSLPMHKKNKLIIITAAHTPRVFI